VLALYVTHPEVLLEPKVPSTEWLLSPKGRARAQAFADRGALPANARIIASTEFKTMETAAILAQGRPFETSDGLRENIRTGSGFLSPEDFERQFHAMFARPAESSGGWETAVDTQRRVVAAVEAALIDQSLTTIFVGHGSAGTFLKCAVDGRPISRSEEQREMAWPGGGNVFAFDWAARTLVRDWQTFEDFAPISD
jgi:broad specificity phosphatase PhoE